MYWWEFNKDAYLALRERSERVITESDAFYMGAGRISDATDSLRPSDAVISTRILPALKRCLDQGGDRSITISGMFALAKIGIDPPGIDVLGILRGELSSRDQEIREKAALALGISGLPAAASDLVALVKDDRIGRKLVGRSRVDERVRSFATYGLGLLVHSNFDLDLAQQALDALEEVLKDEWDASRTLKVAAIDALGLLSPDAGESQGADAFLDSCLSALEDFDSEAKGAGSQLIRAHVPTAIARLLGSSSRTGLGARAMAESRSLIARIEASLREGRIDHLVIQSTILALGSLLESSGDRELSEAGSHALLAYHSRGKNEQARSLALIALGQIGGRNNRHALLEVLQKGGKALVKPWAALALGVLAHGRSQSDQESEADITIGRALLSWFRRIQNPDTRGALAVALGLCGYRGAVDVLLAHLARAKGNDELAGYICIGIGLLGEQRAVGILRKTLMGSQRRPELLRQSATALGLLGDRRNADLLTELLIAGRHNLSTIHAVAAALGAIGDRRSIGPLVEALADEGLTPISRAAAAAALGGIADRSLLPWSSEIAKNGNYRAAVETLTDGQGGVLDIL